MNTEAARALLDLGNGFDEAALEAAYVAAVRRHRPERDPDGFKEVRAAYEWLLAVLENPNAAPWATATLGRSTEQSPQTTSVTAPTDTLAASKDELRQAFKTAGFAGFRDRWNELVPLLANERELRKLGLFAATLTFFRADRKWLTEVWRLAGSDAHNLDEQAEHELFLLELYAGYSDCRREFCNTNPIRHALDDAIVGWGDPQTRFATTAIARWLRLIELQPDLLLDAFPVIGGTFKILPLVEYICSQAPDLSYRPPPPSDEATCEIVAGFTKSWQLTMSEVHARRLAKAEAIARIRTSSLALVVEHNLPLRTIAACLVELNQTQGVYTGSLRRQLQDDYAMCFLDIAFRHRSIGATDINEIQRWSSDG